MKKSLLFIALFLVTSFSKMEAETGGGLIVHTYSAAQQAILRQGISEFVSQCLQANILEESTLAPELPELVITILANLNLDNSQVSAILNK